jgi:hypothetical protein
LIKPATDYWLPANFFMTTRLVFFAIALMIVGSLFWAYRHDEQLRQNVMLVNLGDPNETVRQLLGDPSSEGSCGKLSVAPAACADEYIYKYYYSVFQPQYEVVWFDNAGKVLGEQHVQHSF